MMAENSIQVHEIYQLVRRRLSLQERESIQLFCNKKLITNPTVTIG